MAQFQPLYIRILADAVSVSKTHLHKDIKRFFPRVRTIVSDEEEEAEERHVEVEGGSAQTSRRAWYLAAGRSRRGWRVKASKGGWGDAARKGGGMEEPSLEALMQATLILVVAVAIILSNLLVIASYLNFRGKILFHVLARDLHVNDVFDFLDYSN